MAAYRKQFQELVDQPIEGQLGFFLKRYIFSLGEDWKKTADLATKFSNYADARSGNDLNVTEAADFLQKNGKTRTAKERAEELKDIDLDSNGRICFIEYLLLHYKVMILTEYFSSKGKPVPNTMDLSNDGIGVTGVGEFILEALFTFDGIDPKIEAAIEEVMKQRKTRDETMAELKKTIEDTSKTQVQRMKAQHELIRLEKGDTSDADVALIHLMAGRRKAQREAKNGKKNEEVLNKEKEHEELEKKKKLMESKNKLSGMLNKFQENAKVDPTKFQNKANDRASIKAIRNKMSNSFSTPEAAAAEKDM